MPFSSVIVKGEDKVLERTERLLLGVRLPCLATIVAIKNETGQWRWALFAAGYTTVLAWIVSALVALV